MYILTTDHPNHPITSTSATINGPLLSPPPGRFRLPGRRVATRRPSLGRRCLRRPRGGAHCGESNGDARTWADRAWLGQRLLVLVVLSEHIRFSTVFVDSLNFPSLSVNSFTSNCDFQLSLGNDRRPKNRYRLGVLDVPTYVPTLKNDNGTTLN